MEAIDMNIRINCNSNLNVSALRYIFNNIKYIRELYTKTKNDNRYLTFKEHKRIWIYETSGNMFQPKIIFSCDGKILYCEAIKEIEKGV